MSKRFLRLTAGFLCLTMAFGFSAAAAGDGDELSARRLAALGVFKGTGSGFELEKTPTRAEGVIMLVRLMGGEAEAAEQADAQLPFTDVPAWANGYVAYAYENELSKGTGDTTFGSDTPIDAEMYSTFLLRTLGYADGEEGDFTYGGAVAYAASIGLFDEELTARLGEEAFTRGHVAAMSCAALEAQCKDAETTLMDRLIADGKLTQEAAEAYRDPPEPEADGAEPSGDGEEKPAEPSKPLEVTYYTQAAWCPDFGAMTGSTLTYSSVLSDGAIYVYYYQVNDPDDMKQYSELITGLGYVYSAEYTAKLTKFNQPAAYIDPVDRHVIVVDIDAVTGEFMIYTC